MIHTSNTSTSSSMLSFIQHLLASAGTHTSSSSSSSSPSASSRKRKRSSSPCLMSASTSHNTSANVGEQHRSTPEPHHKQTETKTGTEKRPGTPVSADRENEFSTFLALAGETPIVKRMKTGEEGYRHAQMDGDMDMDGDVPQGKKKLSVICEEVDSDRYGDVDTQDVQGELPNSSERQVWTYRGGDGLQR